MLGYGIQKVLSRLNAFEQAKERYSRDVNLSTEGKTRSLQNVDAERRAYRLEAVRALAEAWSDVRLKWGILQLKHDMEEQKQSRSWDYTQLSYVSQSVRERVQQSRQPSDVKKWYVPMLNSGDRHASRAAAEAGAAAVRLRFPGDLEAYNLALEGDKRLKELLHSPVYDQVYEGMQQLVRDAMTLEEQHARIKSAYQPYGFDVSDFTKAHEGVTLTHGFDADKGQPYTTLNVEEVEGQAVPA